VIDGEQAKPMDRARTDTSPHEQHRLSMAFAARPCCDANATRRPDAS
jgi:hypothetical protein